MRSTRKPRAARGYHHHTRALIRLAPPREPAPEATRAVRRRAASHQVRQPSRATCPFICILEIKHNEVYIPRYTKLGAASGSGHAGAGTPPPPAAATGTDPHRPH